MAPEGAGPPQQGPRTPTQTRSPRRPGHRTLRDPSHPVLGGAAPQPGARTRAACGQQGQCLGDMSSSTGEAAPALREGLEEAAPLPAQRPAGLAEPPTCLASAATADPQLRRKVAGAHGQAAAPRVRGPARAFKACGHKVPGH